MNQTARWLLISTGCALLVRASAAWPQSRISEPVVAAGRPKPACVSPYVWREAFAGDVVCVVPGRRDSVRQENALSAQRVEPGGGSYGPNTCRTGFVWRTARPDDVVCVTPDSRALALSENAAAPARWVKMLCTSTVDCNRQAQEAKAKVAALERRLEQRRNDLRKAEADHEKLVAQLRADDEAWERAHPGLGRSSQPSVEDNVTPVEDDIEKIKKLIEEEKKRQANAEAAAGMGR